MAKTWNDFLPFVKLHITECPNTILEEIVKRVMIDFCEKTKIYRLDADDIDILEDTAEYTPVFSGEYVVPIAVHHAYLGDDQLFEISEHALDISVSDWRNEEGTPTQYILLATNKLQLYPKPNADGDDSLVVTFIVKPSMSATDVPDWMYDDYGMEIAEGTAYILKKMPSKPWTNGSEAVLHYQEYRRGIARARKVALKNKGMMRSNCVNPQPFGGIGLWDEAMSYTEFE